MAALDALKPRRFWPILLAAVPGGLTGQVVEWAVEPPSFSIGGASEDPRYQLSGVVGATLLPDARLIIADHYVQGLRAYGPDGTHLRTVGGEGEGPGEYEYIRGMGRCEAGRIVAFDLHWGRNVYDRDLAWIEERGAELPGLGGPGSAYRLACEPGGHIVATGWGEIGQLAQGYYVATAPVVLVRGGQLIHDFGKRLSSERVGRGANTGPHPFGRQTNVAISGDRVFIGDASEYSVEVYDLTGQSLGRIEWTGPNREISDADYEAHAREVLEGLPEERRPAMRRALSELPRLETFPAYDQLRVDTGGNLWVRSFPRPGAQAVEWRVFTPEGRQLARVPMSSAWTLLDIVDDRVVYVEPDELDIETVHVAGLRQR